jgi:hypothetical protein
MAEFRRIGGAMEHHKRPAGRRVLLPAEVELCQTVGLTVDEYFDFVDIVDSYNGTRPKEYDLIPDVRNDVVTPVLISLAVGVALQAVGALLAPKPRSPQSQERLSPIRTADITGQSRFAPQSEFNSIQDLASLGSVIPLVFTKRGVRVNGQLLWSQFRSKGITQQLNAIFAFSAGKIARVPDYQGYAIGDSLLKSYTATKVNLLFNQDGGRIVRGRSQTVEYTNGKLKPPSGNIDVFSIFWDPSNRYLPVFCQARFPSTQTQFGSYAPMPNGMRFKVNYELVLIPEGLGPQAKEAPRQKSKKIQARFARRCVVINGSVTNTGFKYRIGDSDEDPKFEPFGVEDVRQSVRTTRTNADSNLSIGEIYLAGDSLAVLTGINRNEPWRPGLVKEFTFEWAEGRGRLDTARSLDTFEPNERLVVQRVAVATVVTSRPCDAIEIGIKSRVFRRINGFANVNSNPDEDTIKEFEKPEGGGGLSLGSVSKFINRYSFFRLQRREANKNLKFQDLIPGELFAVRGNTPQDIYTSIQVYHPKTNNWEYRLLPFPGNIFVKDRLYESKVVNLLVEGARTNFVSRGIRIKFTGRRTIITRDDSSNKEFNLKNVPESSQKLREFDAVADYVVYDQEESSNFDGPEHEVTYVNEYTLNNVSPQYSDLAIAGIRIGSSLEWASFNQFSAFFKEGIIAERLLATGNGPINTLPEIVYALLTNPEFGAAELIGDDQVDQERFRKAAQFCSVNGFFWDGVISERQNLRQFIFENAAYCLLDFTIIGGKFSLFPTVPNPVKLSDNSTNSNVKPTIKALFTDGNIRNLQVSFLDPEERQLFKAVVLWRQDTENGFPQTRTLEISLKAGLPGDPEEVFDLSGFCTSEEHATKFAKFALKTRQEVDHGVRFETTPQAALNLEPGDYFRLVSEATHTSRLLNGSIGGDGTIQSLELSNGNKNIFFYKPGTDGVQQETLRVQNGKTTQGNLFGTVFSIRTSAQTDRVYKVESLSYAEDGLIEVAGSNVPLTSSGTLKVLDWQNNQFTKVVY